MSVSDGGRKTTTMGKRGGKPSRKKATVSSQFKVRWNKNIAVSILGGGYKLHKYPLIHIVYSA